MRNFIKDGITIKIFFIFITATIPLIFGAVHPAIQGIYCFIILLGIGGWLIMGSNRLNLQFFFNKSLLIPIFILLYLAFLSLPLPLSILKLLSPARAYSIEMANTLAGINVHIAPLSYNASSSLRQSIFLLSLLLYFTAISVLFTNSKKFVVTIVIAIIVTGCMEALYGLTQVLNPKIGMLWLPISASEAHGTIIYKNQYASFLNLCWPLAFAMGCLQLKKLEQHRPFQRAESSRKRRSVRRKPLLSQVIPNLPPQLYFYFISAVIMMLAVLFSYSRGGILTMCILLAFLILFLPFSTKKKLIVFSLISFVLFFYSSQIGFETLIQRFESISRSAMLRLSIIKASLPIIKDHWLTGIGLESYSYISDTYIKFSQLNRLYDRVHNEYIKLIIELGLPVTFLFLSFLFYRLFLSIRTFLSMKGCLKKMPKSPYFIGIASLGGLLGSLIHGVVDFIWFLPANSLYFVTLTALVSWSQHVNKNKMINKKYKKTHDHSQIY